MLSHESIQELLAGYALEALSGDEAREVERHLPTCAECRRTLADYRHVTQELGHLVPPRVAPSHLEADLRARLAAARVSTRPARLTRLPGWQPLALAAAFVMVLGLGLWVALSGTLSQRTSDRLAESILSSEDAVRVAMVPDDIAPEATGNVVLGEENRAFVVLVTDLPPLPAEQVYQLWLIEGDRRDDGGTYQPDEEVWLVRTPQDLDTYDAIGVTIEPLGGSPGPTGPRVLSTDLPAEL